MKKIIIIGASGLAKEVAFLIGDINRTKREWEIVGFIDSDEKKKGKKLNGLPILGDDEWLLKQRKPISLAFGIGNPNQIKKLSKFYKNHSFFEFPNLIHPNVIGDWENISLGDGNIICAGNILTTSITIGSFNYINLCCTVGHDCIIGNFNLINPSVNLSGGIRIGNESLLGTGSQILQYKKIVDKCIIGAGSVVTKDLLNQGVYVGSPAKKIK